MKNYIRRIKIKNKYYKVYYKNGLEEANIANYSGNGKVAGSIHFVKKIIFIDRTNEPEEIKKTLLHEIIEALNVEYDIGLRHIQIEKLEESVFNVLKKNKKILDFMFDI